MGWERGRRGGFGMGGGRDMCFKEHGFDCIGLRMGLKRGRQMSCVVLFGVSGRGDVKIQMKD